MKRNPKYLPETREVAWAICPGETTIIQAEQDKTTVLIRESWVNKFLDNIPGIWPFGKDEAAIALAAKFIEDFSYLQREAFLRELRNQCVVKHVSSGLKFFKAEEINEYKSQWDIPCYIIYLPDLEPDKVQSGAGSQNQERSSMNLLDCQVEEFIKFIRMLQPYPAYQSTQHFAEHEFESSRRSAKKFANYPFLTELINKGIHYYQMNEFNRAKDCLLRVLHSNEIEVDAISRIDALHFLGRIYYDRKDYSSALDNYNEAIDLSQTIGYTDAFMRGLHERSRIKLQQYKLIEAEVGFRIVLHYYSLKALKLPDLQQDFRKIILSNMDYAIHGLSNVADAVTSISDGSSEADDYINAIGNSSITVNDESGFQFLEIRGIAIKESVTADQQRAPVRLYQKAFKLHKLFPQLSAFALREAEYFGEMKSHILSLTYCVQKLLSESGSHQFYSKPSHYSFSVQEKSQSETNPFSSSDRAASNIGILRDFLKGNDSKQYFVYRGQTREYDAPIFPSSFRNVITGKDDIECLTTSSELYETHNLRKCGKVFYGEYNKCFLKYSNPVQNIQDVISCNGINETLFSNIQAVYKKVLESPECLMTQQYSEKYISWQNALQKTLSKEEFKIYSKYKKDWDIRIDNSHKRLYRTRIFIRLFKYILGTTIAQQYGFSSEGLDATTNIDVACFFATHKSEDFKTCQKEGVGIIYRIPYKPNNIYGESLNNYNYYNCPSIIDLQDVYYRFEKKGLALKDSLDCFKCYFGGAFIEGFQDIDLLFFPEGFFEKSRLSRQGAVIIFPDEIREDESKRNPGVDGIYFPKYRYIEDISKREGVEKFYFKHNGSWPNDMLNINREYLWPRDDFLLNIIYDINAAMYPLKSALPQRFDLIDCGYNRDEFVKFCAASFTNYPRTFLMRESIIQAMQLGTLIF
jgi:tetratricopeptide (TPR) repeat protein